MTAFLLWWKERTGRTTTKLTRNWAAHTAASIKNDPIVFVNFDTFVI